MKIANNFRIDRARSILCIRQISSCRVMSNKLIIDLLAFMHKIIVRETDRKTTVNLMQLFIRICRSHTASLDRRLVDSKSNKVAFDLTDCRLYTNET